MTHDNNSSKGQREQEMDQRLPCSTAGCVLWAHDGDHVFRRSGGRVSAFEERSLRERMLRLAAKQFAEVAVEDQDAEVDLRALDLLEKRLYAAAIAYAEAERHGK